MLYKAREASGQVFDKGDVPRWSAWTWRLHAPWWRTDAGPMENPWKTHGKPRNWIVLVFIYGANISYMADIWVSYISHICFFMFIFRWFYKLCIDIYIYIYINTYIIYIYIYIHNNIYIYTYIIHYLYIIHYIYIIYIHIYIHYIYI